MDFLKNLTYRKFLQKFYPEDLSSGLVVFLVALPLCLGIALASGMPLFSGIISGIVGGLVVALISGSHLSVSGPAAGLIVIVLGSLEKLGSMEGFALAVVIAGFFQLLLGFLRAGIIAAFFPSSVIKGMLVAIGLIVFLKQIPHGLGYDPDYIGSISFEQSDKHSTFSEIYYAIKATHPGAIIICTLSLFIIFIWDFVKSKFNNKIIKFLPSPLIAVTLSILSNEFIFQPYPWLFIQGQHLVKLPAVIDFHGFFSIITFPDPIYFFKKETYIVALTITIIASIESLLCIDASERLDPLNRSVNKNRELKAQGAGNMVAGLFGGLPITSVIIRTSANIDAGAKTKFSAFFHGILLLCSALFFAGLMNKIPIATLSAILLIIGYKLAKPFYFIQMFKKGKDQFIPFIITVLSILFNDLLTGISIGLLVGVAFVIKTSYRNTISFTRDGKNYLIRFQKDATFFNRPALMKYLDEIEDDSSVIIDGSGVKFIDPDILETIEVFSNSSPEQNIKVQLKGIQKEKKYGIV